MKYSPMLPVTSLTLAGFLAIAGCGGDGTTTPMPPSPNAPTQTSLAPAAKPVAAAPGAAAQSAAAANPHLATPDAKYTIICTRYTGAGHVQQARLAKDNLVRATGRREFYVVHEENQSTLYFGYYKQIERAVDPAEAQRAEQDLLFLRSLQDAAGNKLFPGCLKEALPIADPNGPPEYDLARLDHDKAPDDPTRRYWSIAIAGYTVDAVGQGEDAGKNRKQLAVESVIAARKQGIEAYYYHGPNVSTVCIGAWPRSAVREQDSTDAHSNGDNGQDLVVSSSPLPAGMAEEIEKQSSRDIKVFQPKIDIDDPTLLNTWKRYPYYSVDGQIQANRITDPRTGKATIRKQESFLVEIPRLQPAMTQGGADQLSPDSVNGPSAPTVVNPLAPDSGGGQLRSIRR